MKIIKFIQGGELIQLGINKKELYLKFSNLQKEIKLGELKDIKKLSSLNKITLNGESVKMPSLIRNISRSITAKGLLLAKNYTNDEFFYDFLNDFKEMDSEGQLNLIGVSNKWD